MFYLPSLLGRASPFAINLIRHHLAFKLNHEGQAHYRSSFRKKITCFSIEFRFETDPSNRYELSAHRINLEHTPFEYGILGLPHRLPLIANVT